MLLFLMTLSRPMQGFSFYELLENHFCCCSVQLCRLIDPYTNCMMRCRVVYGTAACVRLPEITEDIHCASSKWDVIVASICYQSMRVSCLSIMTFIISMAALKSQAYKRPAYKRSRLCVACFYSVSIVCQDDAELCLWLRACSYGKSYTVRRYKENMTKNFILDAFPALLYAMQGFFLWKFENLKNRYSNMTWKVADTTENNPVKCY